MKEEFINASIQIGNSICRDAITHHNQCNWIGADTDAIGTQAKPFYTALKSCWYNGTCAIAWYLSQLYGVSGERIHRDTCLKAIEHSIQHADKIQLARIGFHSGHTGIGFAAIEIGQKLGEPSLVEKGYNILKELNNLSEVDYSLDVIDGCAGAIPSIIRVQRELKDIALDQLLMKMGEYLLAQSQVESKGLSWNTLPSGAYQNLTGYAHGAAGISIGLLELFAYSQDRRFEKAAMEGFAYEDSCFDITQQNWPDFRNMATTQTEQGPKFSCACAWCHGAPGIGLSRLRAYELTGNPQFYQTANAAANTTYRGLQFKQLGNYSLCHGLFGNAELLLYADQVSKDTTFTQSVEAMAYDAIDKYINHKMAWPNGTQSEYNTPDFMIGMAGIGYGFLRLAEPNRFNSALILN